jgi:hypothetical protein
MMVSQWFGGQTRADDEDPSCAARAAWRGTPRATRVALHRPRWAAEFGGDLGTKRSHAPGKRVDPWGWQATDIAIRLEVTPGTVRSWLDDELVSEEFLGHTSRTVAWLKDAYVVDGRSTVSIAKEVGVTTQRVRDGSASTGSLWDSPWAGCRTIGSGSATSSSWA